MKIRKKNTKNAKNAISSNSFGRKLKNGLSYMGTFRIQELANGDLGMIKKFKNRGVQEESGGTSGPPPDLDSDGSTDTEPFGPDEEARLNQT